MLSSVSNIARILRSFRLDCPELSLTELSRNLNIPKSTMYKLLNTMRSEGFLEKNSHNGKYRPGKRMLSINYTILSQTHLAKSALPFLHSLVERTGLVAHMTCYENGEVIWITIIHGRYNPLLYSRVGRRVQAYAPASGKAILAFLDPKELDSLFAIEWKAITPKTQTNKGILLNELRHIQEIGYSVQREEVDPGIASIGGPVFDEQGKPIASISLAGLVQRFNEETIRELGSMVKRTADEIAQYVTLF